ncbi:histidine kinase [Candidatus Magnetoovum chiemensis]|nr:histidine kinase [Candidatus Magnetoovum chiemensis]
MKTLKTKFMVIITVVSLVIGATTFYAMKHSIDTVIDDFGVKYASLEARVRKNDILPILQRELALSMKMANSPVLKQWVLDENNPQLKELAMKELESFRELFRDKSYFIASAKTNNFYFNNASNEFKGQELRQNLEKDKEDDQWFFSTLKDIEGFDLNIDSNSAIGITKVWFNVVMTEGGEHIAVCGTGLDLSKFIEEVVRGKGTGITTILTGQKGDIKAHPDINNIAFNAITKSVKERKTVFSILGSNKERKRLETAMANLREGKKEVETMFVTIDNVDYIASVAFMPELNWYDIVLVNVSVIMSVKKFIPFIVIFTCALLAVITTFLSFMDRLVLKPLTRLTESTIKIAAGTYNVFIPVVSNDEIGALTASFNKMAAKVQGYTYNLESMIKERTEKLHQAIEASKRIIESVPESIIIADAEGRIVMINEQTQKLLGCEKNELIGKEVETLIPHRFIDKHKENHANFMKTADDKRTGWIMELTAMAGDGREVPVDITLSILDTDEGRQIIYSMRDITERKRAASLEAEKDTAVEAAARAETARAEAEQAREELRKKVLEIERKSNASTN